jgi:hypothetical protein
MRPIPSDTAVTRRCKFAELRNCQFGAEFVLPGTGPHKWVRPALLNVYAVMLQGDIEQSSVVREVVMKRSAKGRRQFVACRLQLLCL